MRKITFICAFFFSLLVAGSALATSLMIAFGSSPTANAVPEAATMLLLGISLFGLSSFARKKFKK